MGFVELGIDTNPVVDARSIVGDLGPLLARARLVQSAAYAAGCPAAVFYTMSEPGFAVAESFGAQACLSPMAEQWLTAAVMRVPSSGVLIIEDADQLPDPAVAGLVLDAAMPVQFVAVVQVCGLDGAPCGILIVADHMRHAGLSPAQTYVLSTHGMQLGAWLASQDRCGVRLDATQEQRRTERLRLLESVVVHANDAVLITEAEPIDLPGPRIVYCNAAFTKTTGYTEAEMLGRTPRVLQSPKVDRVALDRLRRSLERWEPVEVELLNVHKDGTEFWVELSIVPVADETGWFTHWVSVQRDVSHRKQAEETATRARIAEVENRALEAEIAERKRTEERLLHAAFHDDLTRLRNRAYLMERLAVILGQADWNEASQQSDRPARPCAVLFLDLDRFKLVNDSLGHRTGDLLLMEVARRLQACLRPQDTLARVGGDEFAVLVEGTNELIAAVMTAERILEALGRPFKLGQHELFSLCSVGIAQASEHHTKPEELLRDADIAMYNAKKRASGGYAIFNEAMHAGATEALALQTDLRHAVARNEFCLHYQPIYDPSTLRLSGFEALVRWQHPQRGLVAPGQFIAIAEEIGVIRDIDRWVLREACRQMRDWQRRYPGLDAKMSVNVSGDELRDRMFIPELRAVLRANDLDPRRLQLEITESVFLHQPDLIGRVLKLIRAMGVRIAIDDFGTGYSSLGYLDRYEIDTIKIDQSFVARMLERGRAMPIVDAIVRLGSTLNLDIVAEGVETEEQLRMLRSMCCGQVQGYLLGRPVPGADVADILDKDSARAGLAVLAG